MGFCFFVASVVLGSWLLWLPHIPDLLRAPRRSSDGLPCWASPIPGGRPLSVSSPRALFSPHWIWCLMSPKLAPSFLSLKWPSSFPWNMAQACTLLPAKPPIPFSAPDSPCCHHRPHFVTHGCAYPYMTSLPMLFKPTQTFACMWAPELAHAPWGKGDKPHWSGPPSCPTNSILRDIFTSRIQPFQLWVGDWSYTDFISLRKVSLSAIYYQDLKTKGTAGTQKNENTCCSASIPHSHRQEPCSG